MPTRISLTTGGTIVVPESPDEVKRMLSLDGDAPPVTFHPTWALNANLEMVEPEPIALRIEHVSMLANAEAKPVRQRRALDPETVRRIAGKNPRSPW
jgi:hypothetical protein